MSAEEEDVPLVVVRSARELWWEDVANQPPLFCSCIARDRHLLPSTVVSMVEFSCCANSAAAGDVVGAVDRAGLGVG